MYRGFCISKLSINIALKNYLTTDSRNQTFKEVLRGLYTKGTNITSRINAILEGDENGVIDGEALQNACMPTPTDKYDIFISHSHTEENEAKKLAAYLKMRYGLRCFVDGFVWGSCDNDILWPLDKKWSWLDANKESFSYEKRNYSTSLVHAMLSMALLEMIDHCECCIFIKPTTDLVVTSIEDCTTSPWIYEEIIMFNKIEKKGPNRITRCMESFSAAGDKPTIRYRLDMSDMPLLKPVHLQKNIHLNAGTSDYTIAYRWLDDIYDSV